MKVRKARTDKDDELQVSSLPSRELKPKSSMVKRLYRSSENRVLGGVCGGLGEYFNIDPVIIRLLFILFSFAYGIGILAYLIAWMIIPNPNKQE
jgi:phage shock protein C